MKRENLALPPRLTIVTGTRKTINHEAHILRQTARPVDFAKLSRYERWDLVRGLMHALHVGPVGSGLAAPMTGVGLRVVVSTAGETPLALFNPEIVATSGPLQTAEEGNLSLPEVRAPVQRPSTVTVKWQSVNTGQIQQDTFHGWEARVLMHEIEILDGRMFLDHATAPPIGAPTSDADKAQRSMSSITGGSSPSPTSADALSLATLPPSLRGLDSVLTRPAMPVDLDRVRDRHLRALIEDMLRVQYQQRGVGLAAPQVGLSLRLVVMDTGDRNPTALINPVVIDRSDESDVASEGCLSMPGWRGEVRRAQAVKVSAHDVNGEEQVRELSGYAARVAQHEIDHLDGVLFTDRMDDSERLSVVDPDAVADSLGRALQRQEAQNVRRGGGQSGAPKGVAGRKDKRRRR